MKIFFALLLFACSVFAEPPPGYYDFALGSTGEQLRNSLNAIIRDHTVVSYANTEAALMVLDQDPNNPDNVWLLYAQRSEGKTNFGTVEGWNREHVWPNSYGLDSSGPEYSDLFNLRAEDATLNSSRGNKYFDFPNTKSPNYRMPAHPEADFSTATDENAWLPPMNVMGDIARACFYMDVRYGDAPDLVLTGYVTDISSATNYMGRLSTLLQWHIDDPVDDAERLRNDRIFADYQHNRNPFIDHPEWVAQVFWPNLRMAIDIPNPEGRPAIWLYWDRIHAGARLEVSVDSTLTGWFLLAGGPQERDDGNFQQGFYPLNCKDKINCNEFYRLNLRPIIIIKP